MEPVWVADRDRDLTDPNRSRIAKRRPGHRRPARRIDANDGEIRIDIGVNPIGVERSAVGQDGLQPPVALHDMAVRQDETVRGEQDARSSAAPGVDPNHSRADVLDRAHHRLRVGVEKLAVVWTRALGFREHVTSVRVVAPSSHHPNGEV
jgi:hypothetical protein